MLVDIVRYSVALSVTIIAVVRATLGYSAAFGVAVIVVVGVTFRCWVVYVVIRLAGAAVITIIYAYASWGSAIGERKAAIMVVYGTLAARSRRIMAVGVATVSIVVISVTGLVASASGTLRVYVSAYGYFSSFVITSITAAYATLDVADDVDLFLPAFKRTTSTRIRKITT